MNLEEIFKRLGLPKHADVVYDFLNRSEKPRLVSEIAQKTTLPRMTIYRCLRGLGKLNLTNQTKVGKRTVYEAASPQALLEAMKLTEDAVNETVAKHTKQGYQSVPKNVRFLYGSSGIKEAFADVTSHTPRGDVFFRYTSEQNLAEVNKYLPADYRQKRDKKKLERQVISNHASGQQKKSRLERFIKFIPPEADQFEQNIIQLVYGDRMSIIDLSRQEVLLIENRQLAEFQKVIFKLLYKRL